MRLLRYTLTFLLFLPSAASAFNDVSDTHPFAEPIHSMEEKGLMPGYADGYFRGMNYLNRAELVKVIMRERERSQLPVGGGCKGHAPFSDVPAEVWYADDLCNAVQLGIINGYPDGTFHPSRFVNLVEMSKIIANGLELSVPKSNPTQPWFKPYIDTLAEKNALHYSLESFEQLVRRQDIASVLWRVLDKRTDLPSTTFQQIAERGPLLRLDHRADCAVRYEVRYGFYAGETAAEKMWDAQIVRVDTDAGTQSVSLESVKEALPVLQDEYNYTLRYYAQPVCEGVVLQFILMETDHPGGDLYRYTPTFGIEKMAVNDVYRSTFGGEKLSTNHRYIALPRTSKEDSSAENRLYVIDLQKDTSWLAVELPENESLNGGQGLSSQYDIRWNDNHSLSYSVFDYLQVQLGTGKYDAEGHMAPKDVRRYELP